MMTQPEDRSILREIVRIVESRRRVPDKVQVQAREYLITYLEDHRNRLDEALRRYDPDRLNMLFGQLASKIKYQFNRMVPARAVETAKATVKKGAVRKPAAKKPAVAKAAVKRSAKAAPARKSTAKKASAARKAVPVGKRTPAKKPGAKKHK